MTNFFGLPAKQGLYNPTHEHDACGIGFLVHIKGERSNRIVRQALEALECLEHRGARGCEDNTGDGAGILMQIPHDFLRHACEEVGINLPDRGQYGVGMLFFSQTEDCDLRQNCQKKFEEIVTEEGQTFLGWRRVPTDNFHLGPTSRSTEPSVWQAFIGRSSEIQDDLDFDRKLYVIRKRASNIIRYGGLDPSFYVPSLSCRTIVYKGMLTTMQVKEFYPELQDSRMSTAIALVHSRFSTNTFPTWDRSHPYRYLIHNGEINTVRGNQNWMKTRQAMLASELFGEDLPKVFPILDEDGSDSAIFDNCLEFLSLSGRSMSHAAMMMIPEPWENHESMSEERRAFYEYHSCLMEPWDGPASIAFTDGVVVGACLDRNGLRPSRYYVTKDDVLVLASEAGVMEVAPEMVDYKGRLQPGRTLLIDTEEGRIISDEEVKNQLASEYPYRKWLDEHMVALSNLPTVQPKEPEKDHDTILQRQQAFGYTFEDQRVFLGPMSKIGRDPVGSMGNDAPLAVLSNKPHLLYNYFKQLFAQVTNPPLDPLKEEIITSSETTIGPERNLLDPKPENCRQIKLQTPILSDEELEQLRQINQPGFSSITLPILFDRIDGEDGLEKALANLFAAADQAIGEGHNILILSDRGLDEEHVPIPALLAVSGLHHHLIRQGTRTKVGIALESGESREVHHFCLLIGYGVQAVNPYMAFESLADMIQEGQLTDIAYYDAVKGYIKSATKGVIKVMAKMGISTIKSYRGAQIFEAVGIKQEVVDKYFTWTDTRVEGIGLDVIAREALMRHRRAYPDIPVDNQTLDVGGQYQWRQDGEYHLFNPKTIHKLQLATRTNNYEVYKEYAALINEHSEQIGTLRGLLELKLGNDPIPIDEVEPVENIFKRFKTGAMSYGSISKEAHEALAIAMNRIGGKSNTGEGGEDPIRYTLEPNGDSKNSAIKQVASGRFGVTSNYLVHAQELQIKMAQGAKPGEGGELPGRKVYPWIAKVRHSTPGVELISPPPHHDIYSIEDLAQLIHDLKNSNHHARVNVKLVSEVGVGTVAAGVAKGHADVVLISGLDGGTGASPQTSIKHAGLPWELGVAETHQTLVLNNLRSRIIVETDGQLKTGRDVVMATLLGAEEFGFATTPLVSLGCIMMRVCHLDTCPVGVATQNPELRKKFTGDPEHVVNFLRFIAEDMREIMASLGIRTVSEMIGRTDFLEPKKAVKHWKAKGLDLTPILHQPDVGPEIGRYCQIEQDHGLENSVDNQVLLDLCNPALKEGKKVTATLPIKNTNRVVGTILGSDLTRKFGPEGLPEDTINIHFQGSAGQSFAAFTPPGITFRLEGDANDYFGKGLSGSKLILHPPEESTFKPEENIIVGNVAFYGATSGEAYIRGLAGERFCVRNSGVNAVVEGVGDHGCEYMTGGKVVILGKTGRNFAGGMSGGIAYILDRDGDFHVRCNQDQCSLERLTDTEEIEDIRKMIHLHAEYTHSSLAWEILTDWNEIVSQFVKVMPDDYKRILTAYEEAQKEGLQDDDAWLSAFQRGIEVSANV
ncbi:glutamate synthase large subunit [Candidatus Poribacteria bacterium]|nr:glutamate synthase large subunit [Candidatus Poribacteria bacterium]